MPVSRIRSLTVKYGNFVALEDLVRPSQRLVRREARKLSGEGDELHGVHAGDVAVLLGHVADVLPEHRPLGHHVVP